MLLFKKLMPRTKAPPPTCIFSGIQPTGVPHLGNYFGAIQQWVGLQNSGRYDRVFLSVVDLHSITLPHEPEALRQNTLDMVSCLLACGIDPEGSILFKQSSVEEHTELAWILGCLTTMPRLQQLPAWKEKSETLKEVPFGLFTYPILQAADILLYKATHVPVGDDQVKHIELCRELARKFNKRFGRCFPEPHHILTEFKRIKSLRQPDTKMSKSDPDPKSRIDLLDSPDEIHLKLQKSVTDSNGQIFYDPVARPGISNLMEIHAAFTNRNPQDLNSEVASLNKVAYKKQLADVIVERLAPIRSEVLRLQRDPGYVNSVLDKGAERAREVAEANMKEIKQLVGLT